MMLMDEWPLGAFTAILGVVWWNWRRHTELISPTALVPHYLLLQPHTRFVLLAHTHRRVTDGAEKWSGGIFNLWGASEDAYQTATTGWAVHGWGGVGGGGGRPVHCLFILFPEKSTTYLAYQYFSPRDLILDNGRLININFDRTVAAAKKPPYAHIQYFRVNEELPVLFLFLKGDQLWCNNRTCTRRVILLTSTDVDLFFFFVYV